MNKYSFSVQSSYFTFRWQRFFKIVSIFLGALWLSFTLSACASSSITSGEIVSKEYKDSYTSSYMICNQSHGGCKMDYKYHPEEWNITLKGFTNEGEETTQLVHVNETVYTEVNVGEKYTLTQEQIKNTQAEIFWTPVLLISGGLAMFFVVGFTFYVQFKRNPKTRNN